MAAILGSKFGKTKIFGTKKTYIGTFSFIVFTTLCIAIIFFIFGVEL